MKTRTFVILLILVLAVLIITGSRAPTPKITEERRYFDEIMFPGLYWGQPINEVKELIGEPLFLDTKLSEEKTLFYPVRSLWGMPTGMAIGFHPEEETLQSVQYRFLTEHEKNPELYMEEYRYVNEVLTELYGESTKFVWFSPIKEPSFTGQEIVKQLLTMITIWNQHDRIISQFMLFYDGHIEHAFVMHDPKGQDMQETLNIFEHTSYNIKEDIKPEFLQAVQSGNYAEVKRLIEAGADVNTHDNYGVTALMVASVQGHAEIAKLFIELGANVNAQANDGGTALIGASGQGHTEVAKLLIEAGADVNAQMDNGDTALMYASGQGHTEEIAKLLIEAGADIDAKTKEGVTALMFASQYGHIEIAKLLIEAGADVNVQNNDGRTALMAASRFGHPEVVKLLRAAGAKEY